MFKKNIIISINAITIKVVFYGIAWHLPELPKALDDEYRFHTFKLRKPFSFLFCKDLHSMFLIQSSHSSLLTYITQIQALLTNIEIVNVLCRDNFWYHFYLHWDWQARKVLNRCPSKRQYGVKDLVDSKQNMMILK